MESCTEYLIDFGRHAGRDTSSVTKSNVSVLVDNNYRAVPEKGFLQSVILLVHNLSQPFPKLKASHRHFHLIT